jgi:hypothetical protein
LVVNKPSVSTSIKSHGVLRELFEL